MKFRKLENKFDVLFSPTEFQDLLSLCRITGKFGI